MVIGVLTSFVTIKTMKEPFCIEKDEETLFNVKAFELNKRLKSLPDFTQYSFNNTNSPIIINKADIIARETLANKADVIARETLDRETKKKATIKELERMLIKYRRLIVSQRVSMTKEEKEHFRIAAQEAADCSQIIAKVEEFEKSAAFYNGFVKAGKMKINP